MQLLVSKEKEPITPFLAKVQALSTNLGVSSILVIGGAGDYFDVADTVVMMDCYAPHDKTKEAKLIAQQHASNSGSSFFSPTFGTLSRRFPIPSSLQTQGKVAARGKEKLSYGEEDVDLSGVEQLAEVGQTRAIGAAFELLGKHAGGHKSIKECVEFVDQVMDQGLDGLLNGGQMSGWIVGNLARPRRFEVAAALNRYRALQAKSEVVGSS